MMGRYISKYIFERWVEKPDDANQRTQADGYLRALIQQLSRYVNRLFVGVNELLNQARANNLSY